MSVILLPRNVNTCWDIYSTDWITSRQTFWVALQSQTHNSLMYSLSNLFTTWFAGRKPWPQLQPWCVGSRQFHAGCCAAYIPCFCSSDWLHGYPNARRGIFVPPWTEIATQRQQTNSQFWTVNRSGCSRLILGHSLNKKMVALLVNTSYGSCRTLCKHWLKFAYHFNQAVPY